MILRVLMLGCVLCAGNVAAADLFIHPGTQTRWASPENQTAAPGQGGKENRGAKGRAFVEIAAGQSRVLADIKGSGVIRRIWMTIDDRSSEMLRALRLDMYWDDSPTPAVSVPLGDFFGLGVARMVSFENELFSSPEARSFNSYVPMPFHKSARIVIVNELDRMLPALFYDIDYELGVKHDPKMLYFHAYWHRQARTQIGVDFEVLPKIAARGRFLGVNVGVITGKEYKSSGWQEGEFKFYLDQDREYPTLVGTGGEDYIGSGWGQGVYHNRYQGSTIADEENGRWAFYRLHVPDPVYFNTACRVTVQQMGGGMKPQVLELYKAGAELKPVSVSGGVRLLEQPPKPLEEVPEGWVNFYRRDDVTATAYLYVDKPQRLLPPLAPLQERLVVDDR